jgi:hypothetical protein
MNTMEYKIWVYQAAVRWIRSNSNYFEKISEWPEQTSGAFFKYVKKI